MFISDWEDLCRSGEVPFRLEDAPCATSAVMAGKWKVEIVWYLAFGTQRFAELRELLPESAKRY